MIRNRYMKNRRAAWIAAGLTLGLTLATASKSNTVVTSPASAYTGKNYTWQGDSNLFLVRQAAGAIRKPINFSNQTEVLEPWRVKYGNITAGQFGPGLPFEGMNSAGLTIHALWTGASETEEKSAEQARPSLSEFEWIQYHLDCFPDVASIIATLEEVRDITPRSWPHDVLKQKVYSQRKFRLDRIFAQVHFFVSDASQRCAVFDWIDSEQVVTVIENHPSCVQVLGASTYASTLQRFNFHYLDSPTLRLANQRRSRGSWSPSEMFELLDYGKTKSTVWQSVALQDQGVLIFRHISTGRTHRVSIPTQGLKSSAPSQGRPDTLWLAYKREPGGNEYVVESEWSTDSLERHKKALESALSTRSLELLGPVLLKKLRASWD